MNPDPAAARVLVAGGGIIGLSIAWRLAQTGCRVELCERGAIGGEASWAAAGMLAPGGEFESPSPEAELAFASRALYREFARELEETSGEVVDYQENGALELAYSEGENAALQAKAERQRGVGIESKPVSPKHAGTFWPRLDANRLAGARFYPHDGVVDPRGLTRALQVVCQRTGVLLREHCAVDRLEVMSRHIRFGEQSYDFAVIAAGAWSSSIEVTGAPALPSAEPVKGQLIAYQQPAQTCSTIVRQGHHYMLQRSNGLLIVGSSMQRAGFDRSLSDDVTRELAGWAGQVLPHLAETTPSSAWIGFRPAAETLHLRRWHSDRLILAYGHFRNGILLAPITADRVKQLVERP